MTPQETKLSKNFTWGEFTRTGNAALQTQNRAEAEAYRPALTALAELLQPVRDHFGPLKINSGFRGPALNAAIKGSKSSQHMIGEAVDFVPLAPGVDLESVFQWIKASHLPFGQLIYEMPPGSNGWIHLSLGEPWRKSRNRECLSFDGKSYKPK